MFCARWNVILVVEVLLARALGTENEIHVYKLFILQGFGYQFLPIDFPFLTLLPLEARMAIPILPADLCSLDSKNIC